MKRFRFVLAAVGLLAAALPHFGQQLSVSGGPRTLSWQRPEKGLVMWLRADTGATRGISNLVEQWKDRSGNGNHAVQPDGARKPHWRPFALNGRAALHFDGNDFLSRSSGMPLGDYTKVCVFAVESFAGGNNLVSGAQGHALRFSGTDRPRLSHGADFATSSVAIGIGEPHVVIASYDATTGFGALYLDGALVGVGSSPPHTDMALQIGALAGMDEFHGLIAEVRVYDRVLATTDRNRLINALADRYLVGPAFPDVDFEVLPQDGRLFPRDAAGQADLSVRGIVRTTGYDAVVVEITRDGLPWQTLSQPLGYVTGGAPFLLSGTIAAGLFEYEVEVLLDAGGVLTPVARGEHLVCGDAFLVNGQSNAVAADFHLEGLANQSQSSWIRSYGTSAATEVDLDRHWALAQAEAFSAHGAIGTWALRMAELVVADEAVPVAVLNGAVGWTSIFEHVRNDANPTDLATIYGRLLYRAREAGVATKARAMLWYQGEADGENDLFYSLVFPVLRTDWSLDYPQLEKTYVFQIRKGCGVVASGVRDVLRDLPALFPEIEVMSTTAAPAHDGCHYEYAGYRELADRITRVVSRDLYASPDTQNVDPPDVQTATWTTPAQQAILLTFRDPDDTLVWQPGSEAFILLDDPSVTVTGATVSGNTITLQLSGPSTATTVGYDGHPFDGAWITNSRGVGALTFFDEPIL